LFFNSFYGRWAKIPVHLLEPLRLVASLCAIEKLLPRFFLLLLLASVETLLLAGIGCIRALLRSHAGRRLERLSMISGAIQLADQVSHLLPHIRSQGRVVGEHGDMDLSGPLLNLHVYLAAWTVANSYR
jgi:hypothetical protein